MFEVSLDSEFSGCDFEDMRLTKHLPMIGRKLGERPNLSIPGSLESRAEMEAAYRFFDNENVTPEKILATHRARTLGRVCDSEADIYEVMSENRSTLHGRPLEFLIRACQDRATDVPNQKILAVIHACEALHQTTVNVSARTAKTKIDKNRQQQARCFT